MKSEPVVAVVGATGLVGKEMIEILIQREFPYSEILCYASEGSEGSSVEVDGEDLEVLSLKDDSFEGVDIALFATDASISSQFAPLAVKAGAFVIDNSSHFRLNPEIPLVVPEINGALITKTQKIYANPNCSTIQLCMILNIIDKAAGLERVVVSTYQSVSGAGKKALEELWEQCLAIFNQSEMPLEHFSSQIAFNCIPHIDTFLDSGYTKEENKIIEESRKILGLPNLRITATAVRVPVFHAHSESVNVETKKELTPEEFIKLAESAIGVEVFPADDIYPMQITAAGGDTVQVGRVRRDDSIKNGLNLWIVSDNLRKGAALNAIQIAEELMKQ
ncbi:MAG: aspartate-semialdehyde dehydrogenase [bacterium]|nr:aspartate-semialdehyde dehydrogenase [bacterium]